jgi:DNA helicase HerA-like ATPase
MNENDFHLPAVNHRTLIAGRTGSGKTQLGAWLLSKMPLDEMPFIIVDYKRDALLNASSRIKQIGYNDLPKYPGLYILHPDPSHVDPMERWLLNVWRKGNVGLYFDEIYMVPDKAGLSAILTQGRAKRIPAIVVTQRPAWLSRFAFSETDHVAVFHLNDSEDRKKIGRLLPEGAADAVPPQYHSIWYDVTRHKLFHLQPVPDGSSILADIETKLTPRRRVI